MADEFQTYYPLLFAIAYRMLGSASEAEDIVQETYLRYAGAPAGEIRALKAYLTTIVTRLCLDQLKSARVQREQYVGPWLPEPISTADPQIGPLQTVELRESISLAFLVLLETLTPQERAVFLLHEVFEYPYAEVAAILGNEVAHCRQLFHRAQTHLAERRPRFVAAPAMQQRLLERFLVACGQGDLGALTAVLAADVVATSDGGGRVTAARRPILGRDAVIRFMLGLTRKAPTDLQVSGAEINGGPAYLLWIGGALHSAWTVEIADDQIQAIRAVINPDKLAYLQRQIAPPPATPSPAIL